MLEVMSCMSLVASRVDGGVKITVTQWPPVGFQQRTPLRVWLSIFPQGILPSHSTHASYGVQISFGFNLAEQAHSIIVRAEDVGGRQPVGRQGRLVEVGVNAEEDSAYNSVDDRVGQLDIRL